LDPQLRERISDLIRTKYSDLNDCHLTEKLLEVEKISVSRESVRRIRLGMKRPAKRRRRSPKHRTRRVREAREGALVQVDGSHHDWLQGRGPEMSLVGGVDDATGKIVGAIFSPEEDTHAYATVFDQIFRTSGLPVAFYGDGTGVLVRNDQSWSVEEQLQGHQTPPHLGRALQDLGIGYIRARSPQAKGRVENRWGTLQDRLVAEMALRGLCTLEQANAFLPEFLKDFNQRFAGAPREGSSAWRKPGCGWQLVLCCRYRRTVARDNTVFLPAGREQNQHRLTTSTVQIPRGPGGRSYAGCKVEIRELLDGRATVHYRGCILVTDPAPQAFRLRPRPSHSRSLLPQDRAPAAIPKHAPNSLQGHKPDPKHPWSRWQPGLCKRPTATKGGDIFTLQLP
jgi:hypothetical protein